MVEAKGRGRVFLEGQKVSGCKVAERQSAGQSPSFLPTSLEEKNKMGAIRESKIENVPGSLNLQAIFMKFAAATLSQREFAP